MAEPLDLAKTLRNRLQIPEGAPSLPLEAYNQPAQSQGFFLDLAGGAIEAFRSGVADLPKVLQKVTDAIGNAATSEGAKVDRLQIFKQLADTIEPKDLDDQPTLTRKIGRVFGGLAVALPKYGSAIAALGPLGLGTATAIPAMAGVEAATAWGQNAPPKDIAKALLGGAAYGTLLGPVGSKLARWPRAGVVGGGATAIAAAGGETKPEDLALTGLTMFGLGALGPKLPSGLQKQLNKLGYPNEVVNKTSVKRAREIVKNKEKFVAQEPVTETTPVSPVTYGDLSGLINKEQEAQTAAAKAAITDPQGLIYDKILSARGFEDKQIYAMPYETKLAIVNSLHDPTTVKVNSITGQLTLTGKPTRDMAPPPIELSQGKKFIPQVTVEDIAVDPVKSAAMVDALKTNLGRVDVAKLMEPYQGMPTSEIKAKATAAGIKTEGMDRDQMIETIIKIAPDIFAPKVELPKGKMPTTTEEAIATGKNLSQQEARKIWQQYKTIDVKDVTQAFKKQMLREQVEAYLGVTGKESLTPEVIENKLISGVKKPINQELVNQLKWKFGITNADAKKSALLLAEKGITVPTDASKFFESIPQLPKGQNLAKHIQKQTPEFVATEEAKAEAQLTKETQKFEARKDVEAWKTITKEIDKTKGQLLKLTNKETIAKKYVDTPENKAILKKIQDAIQETNNKLTKLTKAEEKILGKEKRTPKSEAEKIAGVKAELERIQALEEAPDRDAYINQAAVLWPNRRMDLATLSDVDLHDIVTNKITPEQAAITPTGKLIKIKLGDKALATILGTTTPEAAEVRDKIKPTITGIDEGQLRAAAEFMGVPYKTVAALPDIDKRNAINTYLQYADQNVEKATKIGKVIEKEKVEATKTYNEIISKNPVIDSELTRLKRKYTELKRKEMKAQADYDADLIDKADLDLIINNRVDTLKAIEKRQNELKRKADVPLKVGDSVSLSSLVKDNNGAIVVLKKVSNNIDEFQLLTKEGQSPIPGDTGLNIAGRARVETVDGKPTKIDFPNTLDIPQQDFFKEEFKNSIQSYYEKQGFGLPGPTGLKLRTGIDIDLAKEMASRLKQKTISIYQGFADRKGTNKRISREEMPSVLKDTMDGEKLKLSDAEIAAMHTESMAKDITKVPVTTMGAPEGISKGDVPMVKATDMLGQSMANANPDIRAVAEKATLNEVRKRDLKKKLVYDANSVLNTIYKKINEQSNAQELREQVSDSFIRKTIPNNLLVLEVKNNIRSFLDKFGDANNLRERKFFIDEYFPLIVDNENTYLKVKGMFANFDNNAPYDKINNPRGLPSRYIIAGQSALSNEEFLELKTIFAANKTWKELSPIEKNRIRYNVLDFEGIYDQWAFLPSDVMARTREKTFNPHLQERTGGNLLSYKHDSQEVLSQYLYTMINKECDRIFKQEVMPIINKYPRSDIIRSVRWYMEKQVKQALGTRTMGARWLSQEVERLNNVIGQEVLNPNFPNIIAGRLAGQVARGAIGPDTAIRNILQSVQTLVNEGPGKFAKGLNSYLEYIKGKGDPEVKKWYDMLLGAEEYYEEVGPGGKALKARLGRAETLPGKGLAFYDWISDMAMSPMRATEHFNKFLAFQTALSEAGERGWSFEKGVRLGLLKSMEDIPDLIIPDAYFNAFKSTITSQYGYSKTMRNPLTRGPVAKISTIFWSYPANTIQFMARGLTEGIKSGDKSVLARFGLYAGFQLTIAAAMAQLGMDVSSIFGVGLMPVKILSVPWEIMKGAYQATFGQSAEDKSSGADDLLNALGIISIPQFRYGAKALRTATDLERGYKAAGKQQLMTMETSPLHAIMDLTGFPYVGSKATYDLYQQMRDEAYTYRKDKQDLVLKGINALDKGKMEDVRQVFEKAQKNNIVLTYSELSKYYRTHKTITYLQAQLKRLPKHLRPAMQKRIQELEEGLMPSKFGKAENVAGRSMWSGEQKTEEEE
jgi:hypothetical protein